MAFSRITELLASSRKRMNIVPDVVQNPSLLLEQDDNGRTLLHNAVSDAIIGERWVLSLKDSITPEALSVKDNNGNTPIHLAALNNDNIRIRRQILPLYLKLAEKFDLDINTKNHDGRTPMQLAEDAEDIYKINEWIPSPVIIEYFASYAPNAVKRVEAQEALRSEHGSTTGSSEFGSVSVPQLNFFDKLSESDEASDSEEDLTIIGPFGMRVR